MNYYFAPMEGITGYLFRNIHAEQFPGADRYYSPFLSANHNYSFQNKEKRDVAPENNRSTNLVPQLLTKQADEFVWGALELARAGYSEINLNLGCPSSTVASKGKGSGFLADPEGLDRFFDRTFELLARPETIHSRKEDPSAGKEGENIPAVPGISVKTRIGYADAGEALPLMRIFNRYPISELIIHARVRTAMYKGVPDIETFSEMYAIREIPVAYNGDVYTKEDAEKMQKLFPDLSGIMCGRGAIADPALIRECRGGEPLTFAEWKTFHDRLAAAYFGQYSERIAIGRMKELWYYWERLFPGEERAVLTVKKARDRMSYTAAVNMLIREHLPA